VTHIDGIVLARSSFEHDVNYRSAVLVGEMSAVGDEAEKLAALEAFMERLIPGRWAEARQPSRKELKATSIVAMPIDEASAKVRSGGAEDGDSEDAALDVWAGQIPISTVFGEPLPDADLRDRIPVSAAALAFVRDRSEAR
jgi:hypothetical protein